MHEDGSGRHGTSGPRTAAKCHPPPGGPERAGSGIAGRSMAYRIIGCRRRMQSSGRMAVCRHSQAALPLGVPDGPDTRIGGRAREGMVAWPFGLRGRCQSGRSSKRFIRHMRLSWRFRSEKLVTVGRDACDAATGKSARSSGSLVGSGTVSARTPSAALPRPTLSSAALLSRSRFRYRASVSSLPAGASGNSSPLSQITKPWWGRPYPRSMKLARYASKILASAPGLSRTVKRGRSSMSQRRKLSR